MLCQGGTPLSHYAVAAAVVAERTFGRDGIEGVLAVVDVMRYYINRAELEPLRKYLAALTASFLADAERVEEAQQVWWQEGLPKDFNGCLDLSAQSWREMEALSCARVRMLAACREFGEARDLARLLVSASGERGLRRTAMRGLALQVALAHRTGDAPGALRHLEEFLRLYEQTDYARGILREGEAACAVLLHFVQAAPAPARTLAERLLTLSNGRTKTAVPDLSEREMDILERLVDRQDREIADALGISKDGVRYHIRKIFRKLDAGNRQDAVDRARRGGLLPNP